MTKERKKIKNAQDGHVWTTYADMFTTMAVIFLTMFVFAMLKVGVSTIERVAEKKAHQKELLGVQSEESKRKNEHRVEKIDQSIKKVTEYEDVINQKVIELNQLVKDLEQNKDVMKELAQDQVDKEAMLERVSKALEQKKKEWHTAKQNERIQEELQAELKDSKIAEVQDSENSTLGEWYSD